MMGLTLFKRPKEVEPDPKFAVLEALAAHAEEFTDKWTIGPHYADHGDVRVWIANGVGFIHVEINNMRIDREFIPATIRIRLWNALSNTMKPYRDILEQLKK